MKKILFVIVCLAVVSTAVFGQGQGQRRTPEQSAQATTDWMKTECKLTDKQVAPVNEINLTFAKAQQKLMENAAGGGGDFTAMREARQKLEDQRVKDLEKILSKEQVEAYKKAAAERMQRGPGGGQGGGQGGGGNRPARNN